MKIEIEIDENLVVKAVIDKLVDQLYHQVRLNVEHAVKDSIRSELQDKAREHISEILRDFRLPDGRTFKEYLQDLLLKPEDRSQPVDWVEKPKLFRIAEERLWRDTTELFRELSQPVLAEYKAKLRTRFAQHMADLLNDRFGRVSDSDEETTKS